MVWNRISSHDTLLSKTNCSSALTADDMKRPEAVEKDEARRTELFTISVVASSEDLSSIESINTLVHTQNIGGVTCKAEDSPDAEESDIEGDYDRIEIENIPGCYGDGGHGEEDVKTTATHLRDTPDTRRECPSVSAAESGSSGSRTGTPEITIKLEPDDTRSVAINQATLYSGSCKFPNEWALKLLTKGSIKQEGSFGNIIGDCFDLGAMKTDDRLCLLPGNANQRSQRGPHYGAQDSRDDGCPQSVGSFGVFNSGVHRESVDGSISKGGDTGSTIDPTGFGEQCYSSERETTGELLLCGKAGKATTNLALGRPEYGKSCRGPQRNSAKVPVKRRKRARNSWKNGYIKKTVKRKTLTPPHSVRINPEKSPDSKSCKRPLHKKVKKLSLLSAFDIFRLINSPKWQPEVRLQRVEVPKTSQTANMADSDPKLQRVEVPKTSQTANMADSDPKLQRVEVHKTSQTANMADPDPKLQRVEVHKTSQTANVADSDPRPRRVEVPNTRLTANLAESDEGSEWEDETPSSSNTGQINTISEVAQHTPRTVQTVGARLTGKVSYTSGTYSTIFDSDSDSELESESTFTSHTEAFDVTKDLNMGHQPKEGADSCDQTRGDTDTPNTDNYKQCFSCKKLFYDIEFLDRHLAKHNYHKDETVTNGSCATDVSKGVVPSVRTTGKRKWNALARLKGSHFLLEHEMKDATKGDSETTVEPAFKQAGKVARRSSGDMMTTGKMSRRPSDGMVTTGKVSRRPSDGMVTTGKVSRRPSDGMVTTGKVSRRPSDGMVTTGKVSRRPSDRMVTTGKVSRRNSAGMVTTEKASRRPSAGMVTSPRVARKSTGRKHHALPPAKTSTVTCEKHSDSGPTHQGADEAQIQTRAKTHKTPNESSTATSVLTWSMAAKQRTQEPTLNSDEQEQPPEQQTAQQHEAKTTRNPEAQITGTTPSGIVVNEPETEQESPSTTSSNVSRGHMPKIISRISGSHILPSRAYVQRAAAKVARRSFVTPTFILWDRKVSWRPSVKGRKGSAQNQSHRKRSRQTSLKGRAVKRKKKVSGQSVNLNDIENRDELHEKAPIAADSRDRRGAKAPIAGESADGRIEESLEEQNENLSRKVTWFIEKSPPATTSPNAQLASGTAPHSLVVKLKRKLSQHEARDNIVKSKRNVSPTRKSSREWQSLASSVITARLAKPHVCSICHKAFRIKWKMNEHERIVHSSKRPFRCHLCGTRMKRKKSFDRHMLVHTRGAVFECDQCGRKFTQRHGLRVHSWTHVTERTFKCVTCGRMFASAYQRKRHFREKHISLKVYYCNVCKTTFPTRLDLNVHRVEHLTPSSDQ